MNRNQKIAIGCGAAGCLGLLVVIVRLFQAAGMTKDNELILRVLKKIGFASTSGSDYQEFVQNHFAWAMKNLQFITSVNTPEKARAYVDAHIDD